MGTTTNLQFELKRLSEGTFDSRVTIIEQTCERLRSMARRMIKRFPGVGRWTEEDDVLQNSLIRLHRSLNVVRPDNVRKFYGLAATQIRRELIDLARKFSGPEGLGNHDSDANVAAEIKPDLSQEPSSLDDWTLFHQSVEKLPESLQEVFNLLFYNSVPQGEAARVLGISLATLKRRWLAARISLREICGEDFLD
jgi:RNA polymerase sigma factor (sigma-70 family)